MSTASAPRRRLKSPEINVSAYDRVSGLLVASIIIVGFFTLLLFLIWLTSVLTFTREQVAVTLVENIAGRGDHAKGLERDIEAPGIEELEEEIEPQVEQLLEAVTDVVSTQAASLDAFQTDAVSSNVGAGVGDSRPPGPLGEGDDIIPRWERWEIRYTTSSQEAYARQLDFFNIELGAIGRSPQVDYAANLTRARASTRSGSGDAEERLYMTWTGATPLKQWDEQMLSNAGIQTRGRIVVQFYPKPVENQLAVMELAYAQANGRESVKQIKKTVFGVRRAGAGYEYYVMSQQYRAVPA